MIRPRKDSGVLAAEERIVRAFFAVAQKRVASEITVTSVLRLAECNRSTFYYHFENLRAVQRAVEERFFRVDRYRSLLDFLGSRDDASLVDFYTENREAIEYLGVQLAGDSSGESFDRFCGALAEVWGRLGFLPAGGLDDRQKSIFVFVCHGLAGLFGEVAAAPDGARVQRLGVLTGVFRAVVLPGLEAIQQD